MIYSIEFFLKHTSNLATLSHTLCFFQLLWEQNFPNHHIFFEAFQQMCENKIGSSPHNTWFNIIWYHNSIFFRQVITQIWHILRNIRPLAIYLCFNLSIIQDQWSHFHTVYYVWLWSMSCGERLGFAASYDLQFWFEDIWYNFCRPCISVFRSRLRTLCSASVNILIVSSLTHWPLRDAREIVKQ